MKIKLLALLILTGYICFAQKIPINKYGTLIEYDSFKNRLNLGKPNSFSINYNHINYMNAFYGEAIKNGDITFVAGGSLDYRKQLSKQFIIDCGFLYNLLNLPDMILQNYGFEISGGLILMPFTLKLTSVFQPYIAWGYQFTGIYVFSSENAKVVETLKDTSVDTSAPIWKAGMMLNVTKTMFLNVYYKQSFTTTKDRNFNSWSAGLGFRY